MASEKIYMAKRKITGDWVYGTLRRDNGSAYIVGFPDPDVVYEVDPATVGECRGRIVSPGDMLVEEHAEEWDTGNEVVCGYRVVGNLRDHLELWGKGIMILEKWDWKRRKYLPHPVPAEWHCSTLENDMHTLVNCASCGKELPYLMSYTSLEIHTGMGLGYAVCEDCHRAEYQRKMEAQHELRSDD